MSLSTRIGTGLVYLTALLSGCNKDSKIQDTLMHKSGDLKTLLYEYNNDNQVHDVVMLRSDQVSDYGKRLFFMYPGNQTAPEYLKFTRTRDPNGSFTHNPSHTLRLTRDSKIDGEQDVYGRDFVELTFVDIEGDSIVDFITSNEKFNNGEVNETVTYNLKVGDDFSRRDRKAVSEAYVGLLN